MLGRFEEMNDRIKCGRGEDRLVLAARTQQHAENQTAKERFFNYRDDERGADNSRQRGPVNRVAQRINVKGDDDCAAAEQGSGRKNETGNNVAKPMIVGLQREIGHRSHANGTEKRPEQNQSGKKQSAMKESFEIKLCQEQEPAMPNDPLRAPKESRREQRAEENGRDEINEQSGCVLQGC